MTIASVIAKLQITSSRDFGATGWLTILNCVCENDLMAAYAGSEEDRLFTKYSPWGEAQVGAALAYGMVALADGEKFYAVTIREPNPCAKARKVVKARCNSITDHGDAQAKVVEIVSDHGEKTGLRWRMSIDNPPAVAFFEPGKGGYAVAFYSAKEFTRDEALADAHAA